MPSGRGQSEANPHHASSDGRVDAYFHSTFLAAVDHRSKVPCAACWSSLLFAALPRLRLHSPVACVHVPRGAVPTDAAPAPRAARGVALARPRHDEHRVARVCCANDKHRQV